MLFQSDVYSDHRVTKQKGKEGKKGEREFDRNSRINVRSAISQNVFFFSCFSNISAFLTLHVHHIYTVNTVATRSARTVAPTRRVASRRRAHRADNAILILSVGKEVTINRNVNARELS